MGFQIRRIKLTSPTRPPAEVRFSNGLNVIAGASDTGKSLIVELIRYGLGAQELQKKDVPETEPYDRLFLVVETDAHEWFTIERALAGGDAILYQGDVSDRSREPEQGLPSAESVTPEEAAKPADGRVIPVRSSPATDDTLPGFLLKLCDLSGRRVKDKQASTRNLSFRDLRELVILDEERIISTSSPAQSGERTDRTAEQAVLSLLLTGVDDSAIVLAEQADERRMEHQQKAEKIAFLLEELRADVPDGATLRTIGAQLKRLDKSVDAAQQSYAEGFTSVSSVESDRRKFIKERSELRARLESLSQLTNRFTVLQDKYDSDVQRLSAVGEATAHFSTLSGDSNCPVCGVPLSVKSTHHSATLEDPAMFFQGIEAERKKIIGLKEDLVGTLTVLTEDIRTYSKRQATVADELRKVEERLDKKLKPDARNLSEKLAELLDKRTELRSLFATLERIEKYKNERFQELASAKALRAEEPTRNDTQAKDNFAKLVGEVLSAWKYPEASRVHFDDAKQDIVINGKHRGALGKGYRAVTASAFQVALLQFCTSRNAPHAGFVVLDTPVRTFKDRSQRVSPGEIVSDAVKDAFFIDLSRRLPARQIIVAENDEPPVSVRAAINYVFFSKEPNLPPAGFIPPDATPA